MVEMANAIQEITQSSEQTGKIIKTIDEIAFQTNLEFIDRFRIELQVSNTAQTQILSTGPIPPAELAVDHGCIGEIIVCTDCVRHVIKGVCVSFIAGRCRL